MTSRYFRRVQECAIRSSSERVIAVQRHEEIKHHRGPRPCVPEEQFFGAFPRHALVWATNMSPNFVYFKVHSRGLEVGAINWSLEDLRRGFFTGRRRGEKAIGVQGLRGLDCGITARFSYSTLMTMNSNLYFLHLIIF